ncbi:hypothetical protein NLG97_g7508 [Lecanicillium saksenae]|uniref:Uncharacterized protein n=1 Tax=Lecanicillium saksenae TaxID=468837 RepID=A0ACC1QLL6_9HYPO|nr:hypothetical protein NLG97_g7508 [Lecanicillium saksenae]
MLASAAETSSPPQVHCKVVAARPIRVDGAQHKDNVVKRVLVATFERLALTGRALQRRHDLERRRAEALHEHEAVLGLVLLVQHAHHRLGDAGQRRSRGLGVTGVEHQGLLVRDVKVQVVVSQAPVEEVA